MLKTLQTGRIKNPKRWAALVGLIGGLTYGILLLPTPRTQKANSFDGRYTVVVSSPGYWEELWRGCLGGSSQYRITLSDNTLHQSTLVYSKTVYWDIGITEAYIEYIKVAWSKDRARFAFDVHWGGIGQMHDAKAYEVASIERLRPLPIHSSWRAEDMQREFQRVLGEQISR